MRTAFYQKIRTAISNKPRRKRDYAQMLQIPFFADPRQKEE
jgi:hypothetical protein